MRRNNDHCKQHAIHVLNAYRDTIQKLPQMLSRGD